MRILHLDANHPLLIKQLDSLGYTNDQDYTSSKIEIESKIHLYDGCILRSRFTIDEHFLNCGKKLKFIGRVGAGLENIDGAYAKKQGIRLIAAPEGNSNAVGEHALGMLLSLFNNLNKADLEIRNGKWLREENRGLELEGKIIGIIGYGNMGKSFAKKLRGFDVQVFCYDLAPAVGDDNCLQTSLENIQNNADILSIHTPQTDLTKAFINSDFIHKFKKNFWIINTARGSAIVTKDLVNGLKSGKILGAALDVLEYEKTSFETLFSNKKVPEAFDYLIKSKNVLLSPHIAGWTFESNIKLAQTIVDKIKFEFPYFILKNI